MQIRAMHRKRLIKVLELLREPKTIVEVSSGYLVTCMAITCCWRLKKPAPMSNISTNGDCWDREFVRDGKQSYPGLHSLPLFAMRSGLPL